MEELFVRVFSRAALQAGAVARRLQGQVPLQNKGGGSPESAALTAVDLATQDVILLALAQAMPQVAVDAEEDTETVRLFEAPSSARALVVIDPVDGTLNYSRGEAAYAVMGSLVVEGYHRAAVVYFPHWGELYFAIRGQGCWRTSDDLGRSEPERVEVGANQEAQQRKRLLVSPSSPRDLVGALRREGFEVDVSRCSAVDSSAPATGRALGSIAFGRADRRRALALLLTLEAGGIARCGGRDWLGEDREFGLEPPIITAPSRDVAERIEETIDRLLGRDGLE